MADPTVPNLAMRLSTLAKLVADDLVAMPEAPVSSDPVDDDAELEETSDGQSGGQDDTAPATKTDGDTGQKPHGSTDTPVVAAANVVPSIQYMPPSPNMFTTGGRRNTKSTKERKIAQRKYRRQFKRVQRYLGLRPRMDHLTHPNWDDNVPDDLKEEALSQFKQAIKVPPIDPDETCGYEFEEQVLFICADMEWKETASSAITEIGLAYLDTNDLVGVKPGKHGVNWHDKIQTRHFRIKEHLSHVNQRFVMGCPENFEFGESELISIEDARKVVSSCFQAPFYPFSPVEQILSGTGTVPTAEPRKIVFVGHDPHGDIDALRRLKFNVYNTRDLLEIVDTNHIWNVLMRDRQGKKLQTILGYFGQDANNAHNAGNDARYTMQALLAMVVHHAEVRETEALDAERNALIRMRKDTMASSAFEALTDDAEGWETETDMRDPREQPKEIDGGDAEFWV